MAEVKYPEVTVHLSTGVDGNVFSIIGKVADALRRGSKQGAGPEAAKEFSDAAFNSGSYDEVLRLAMCTVDVT
jgi:hypothetical protein